MAKKLKVSIKRKIIQISVAVVIILLVLLAGFFAYRYFFSSKMNNYLIENKYYGFKLQTPKSWIAEENTTYSEDNITQLLEKCKNDKSTNEIGAFRFESSRYPDDLAGSLSAPTGFSSGTILEITVSCISDSVKSGIVNSTSSNLKVGGEQTFEEVLNSPEFGKTNQLSFLHNNLQYKATEYVYISPSDKNNEASVRQGYAGVSNKIISSFIFTK
jgi:hypothetical protein